MVCYKIRIGLPIFAVLVVMIIQFTSPSLSFRISRYQGASFSDPRAKLFKHDPCRAKTTLRCETLRNCMAPACPIEKIWCRYVPIPRKMCIQTKSRNEINNNRVKRMALLSKLNLVSTKRVTTERIFGNPAFDEYDTNKDKQITVLEFQKRLDIYQTLAQKLIQMADSNGDKSLDCNEFRTAVFWSPNTPPRTCGD